MSKIKEISLTQGYVAIVDEDMFNYLNQWSWYYSGGYAIRKDYDNNKDVHMHRVINETPKEVLTDHINGNTLDNRRSNLRNCSNTQNQWNQKPRLETSTDVKGVTLRSDNIYEVTVNMEYKGRYSNLNAAINAYNYYAKEKYGEFAWLNDVGIYMDKDEFVQFKCKVKKTSKFTGVFWSKRVNKWEANAYVQGKQKFVGYFDSEIDAAKSRNNFIDQYNSTSKKNVV